MKALAVLIIPLFFFSAPTHASLITLESQWCCAGMPGTLTFTYENTTPDSFPDTELDGQVLLPGQTQKGIYNNAIVSASYVVTDGVNKDKVFNFSPGSSSTISIVRKYNTNGTTTSIFMNLYDGDTQLDVFMNTEGLPPVTDYLLELPYVRLADMASLQLGFKILDTSGYAGGFVFKEVATAPVPAAAWLFGPALLGLIGISRARK